MIKCVLHPSATHLVLHLVALFQNTLACTKPISEAITNGKIKIYPLPHMGTSCTTSPCLALRSQYTHTSHLTHTCGSQRSSGIS
jgi:hypothetical protein